MTGILPTLITILIILFLVGLYVANYAWYIRKEKSNDKPKELKEQSPERYIKNITSIIQNSKAVL
jgi:cytochrome c-type biogenesis protein CcmH/NrfG